MRVYTDEDFPAAALLPVRAAGHDVLTALAAGMANRGLPDSAQLEFAVRADRLLLTMNRNHFAQLHRRGITHSGIVVCTRNFEWRVLGDVLVLAFERFPDLRGRLLRVQRGGTVLEPPSHGD